MIVGRFWPLHRGHDFAVRFAAEHCEDLFAGLQSPPAAHRTQWGHAYYVNEDLGAVLAEIRQLSDWKLRPGDFDLIYGSGPQAQALARRVRARFVPVDWLHELVPVNSDDVRANPFGHWDDLLPAMKALFARRVCLFGGESTGKTMLAQRLAQHYRTQWVSEYVRGYAEAQDNRLALEDMDWVARGQIAQEEALARFANRVLICDTNLFSTLTWSDFLYGEAPPWIRREANRRRYHLILLTDPNAPYTEDPQRCLATEEERLKFHRACVRHLESRLLPYMVLKGDWEERFQTACKAIDQLIPDQLDHQ